MRTMKEYRQSAGLTVDELAELAGVTHDLVIKFETAVFTTASPPIVEALCEKGGFSASEILDDYIAQRAANASLMANLVESNAPPPWQEIATKLCRPLSTKHPHQQLREWLFDYYGLTTSAYYYCRAMGIPHSSLHKYESGKEAFLPVRLRDSLTDLHVPVRIINLVNELGYRYAGK